MDSPKLCNPLVLAYQGDVVYELLVRRRLIETTRLGVSALHRETVKRVCAHYQSQAMEILEPMLTQEELEIYKRGRNASSHVPRHADVLEYRRPPDLKPCSVTCPCPDRNSGWKSCLKPFGSRRNPRQSPNKKRTPVWESALPESVAAVLAGLIGGFVGGFVIGFVLGVLHALSVLSFGAVLRVLSILGILHAPVLAGLVVCHKISPLSGLLYPEAGKLYLLIH